MWTLHIQGGLHDGASQALKQGLNRIGGDETADILLLDPDLPRHLLDLELSEAGHLLCCYVAQNVDFSYDGLTWSVAQPEPLFAVNSRFRACGLTLLLIRSQTSDSSASLGTGQFESTVTDQSHPAVTQSGWLGVFQRLKRKLHIRAAGFRQWYQQKPLLALSAAGCLVALVCLACVLLVSEIAGFGSSQPVTHVYQHPTGLGLSYQLSLDHAAPPAAFQAEDMAQLLKPPEPLAVSEAAGQDLSDALSTMRLSYSLSVGRPLEQAEKQSEPAFVSLREQVARHPWGDRVIINAIGRNISLRAQLSEADRRELEKIMQRTVREYGNDFALNALVDPLEPLPDLQIKQVLGGDSPVIVLQDGSRLIPGSVYEGRVVESITTSRVVLRGKDRIELAI
jgi:hypothetical protein